MRSGASILVVMVAVLQSASSQGQPVQFTGSLSLSSEQYVASGILARRPHGVSRAILRPTIALFGQIVLPFEIYYSTQDKGFRQPFNQFGVSPRLWGWLTLHAGYFSSRISELTFGDTRLLGGGVEVNMSDFRFMFLFGRAQRALDPDTVRGVRGEFKRMVVAAKVGVGNERGLAFDVNFLRVADDSRSITISPAILTPKENVALSLGMRFPLFANVVRISIEAGISAFTHDTGAPELKNTPHWVKTIFTPRYSSQIDGAIKSSLRATFSQHVSLSISGRWVGPGFATLGYAQLPSDVIEWTVAPVVRLMENKLILRSSVGMRVNNLRNDRLAKTRRLIINSGITVQPGTSFGIDIQYMNYGMRSRPRLDSLRVENVTQSLTVMPRYNFASWGGANTVAVTYTRQDFSDLNAVSNVTTSNSVNSGSAFWTLTFPSSLSLTTSAVHTIARTQVLRSTVTSLNEMVGHAFLDNKLQMSTSFGYTVNITASRDGQLHGSVRASYSLAAYGSFTFMLSAYNYDYGTPGVSSYREVFGSVQYTYAL
jgi:hypothetical protein